MTLAANIAKKVMAKLSAGPESAVESEEVDQQPYTTELEISEKDLKPLKTKYTEELDEIVLNHKAVVDRFRNNISMYQKEIKIFEECKKTLETNPLSEEKLEEDKERLLQIEHFDVVAPLQDYLDALGQYFLEHDREKSP